MTIYIAADHRGFTLKGVLVSFLKDQGLEVIDLGAETYDKDDDYPLYAGSVAHKISISPDQSRGIVICGSGAGVAIAANKFKRVRCLLASSPDQVYESRNDDDINVLAFAADFIKEEDAKKMITVFLATPFSKSERALRRLQEISQIEDANA